MAGFNVEQAYCCDVMGRTHRARHKYEKCKTSVEKSEGEMPVGRPGVGGGDNIKMNSKEVWPRKALVNMATNLKVT